MKLIGEYTVRGKVDTPANSDTYIERINLFDGRFDTAYKVVEFVIYPETIVLDDCVGILTTSEDTIPSAYVWDWGDNRQIAWSYAGTVSFGNQTNNPVVDPDNLVVEDLYIHARNSASSSAVNYFIRMEKYDITDSQGALAMVRNRSQA